MGHFCLWNPESRKSLIVKSGILVFGIRNSAHGIWNSANNGNFIQVPLTRAPESSTWNLESTAWSPESNAKFDYLTCQGDRLFSVDLDPLNLKSDQHQISPCNIDALYNSVVMRIMDMITQDEFAWYSPHYFCRKWIGATNENSNFNLRV